MVFLIQLLCCSGTFGDTKFRHMKKSEAVENRTGPPLELNLILNPPTIPSKNTILLSSNATCSLKDFSAGIKRFRDLLSICEMCV